MRSWGWLMRKFSSDRSVWAPQYLSEGTWISPKASLSERVAAILRAVAWRSRLEEGVRQVVKDDVRGRRVTVKEGRPEAAVVVAREHVPASLTRALGAVTAHRDSMIQSRTRREGV